MGLCHEFGTQIRDGCDHPMHANPHTCSCPECDAVCKGLFEGCPDVWERGPQAVTIAASRASVDKGSSATRSPMSSKPPASTKPPSFAPDRPKTSTVAARAGDAAFSGSAKPDVALNRRARGNGGGQGSGDSRENGGNLIGNGTIVSWDKAVDASIGDLQLTPPPSASERIRGLRAADTSTSASTSKSDSSAPSPSTDAPRSDVLEWFGEAFDGLRQELHNLAVGMTQQEAMVAELLDTRQGELRLVLVAEALPDLVADAVRQAMGDHLASVSESFDTAVGILRQELKRNKKATDASVEALRGSMGDALAQVARSIEVHTAALSEGEAARARAVKAAVTRQVAPLVATTEESQASTVAALALLGRKLDRLSGALEKGRPITASPSPPARTRVPAESPAKAQAKPPAARKRTAPRSAAPAQPVVTPGEGPSLGDDEE